MDPAEVELLWGALNGCPANWDWQRANGWYATPAPVPEDALLQDWVLGLLGRDPSWRPPGHQLSSAWAAMVAATSEAGRPRRR